MRRRISRFRFASLAVILVAGIRSAEGASAEITAPAPGSPLGGAQVTFTWNLAGGTCYWLDVGASSGGNNIFSQNMGRLTSSAVVNGLPTDGSAVYVRLWTATGATPENATWSYNDYSYVASGGANAVMVSPPPNSVIGGGTQSSSITFTWNPAPGVASYWLNVGPAAGSSSAYGASVGTATQQTVGYIPTHDDKVFVRLWTIRGSPPNTAAEYTDYVYYGTTGPKMISPGAGSTLTGASQKFTWNGVTFADGFAIQVGNTQNASDLFGGPDMLAAGTSVTATGLPTDGRKIYVALQVISGDHRITSHYQYNAPMMIGPGSDATIQQGSVAPVTPAVVAATGSSAGTSSAALMANFPPVGGAIRQYFSSSRSKSSWQERANFAVAGAPDTIAGTYGPQLTAAGWTESSRSQLGDATAHTLQITIDLLKDQTHGHVVLAQNAQGGTDIASAVTTQFPVSSAPSLFLGTTAAPATGATSSPNDRGPSDPADFPRLPSSIRSSFSTNRQPTMYQEIGVYSAKTSPAAADAFYVQALPPASWEENTRTEELNDVTKSDQINMTWQKGSRFATVGLNGSTAGTVDVRVTISQPPP